MFFLIRNGWTVFNGFGMLPRWINIDIGLVDYFPKVVFPLSKIKMITMSKHFEVEVFLYDIKSAALLGRILHIDFLYINIKVYI